MAAKGIRIQASPTASEAKDTLGVQEKTGSIRNIELQPGSHPRALEEQKPDEQSGPPIATGALEPNAADDSNGSKIDDKRQANESQGSVDGDENGEESAGKKQKVEQSSQGENGTSASAATESNPTTSSNGVEQKKPGRPKKPKDISKKLTPRSTEGIGSRTRSQTKAT